MRSHRSLRFDGLEARQLLAHAGPTATAAGRVHAMVEAMPIALDGGLTVNQKGADASIDDTGEYTVMMPVRGTFDGVGPVQGFWVETQDSTGNLDGPDSLQLHNAHGSFAVTFINPLATTGSAPTARGKAAHVRAAPVTMAPQHVQGGTKAYAHATEAGTITLVTDARGKNVIGFALTTTGG